MYVSQVFKIVWNMSVWFLLLICHLDLKPPTNGLNSATKMHKTQMKRWSGTIVFNHQSTPVQQ